ncbi:MAG: SIS domain-containing protein, partial [Planctomycetota bacterium]
VDAGLTPYEALKAGTRDAAECLGELDEFGTITAGLRADLILVEDNPLVDVGNAARRIGVMVRGRWLPQSELRATLDALAIKHATEENPDGVMLRGRWYPRSVLEAMVDAQNERKKVELVEAVLSSDRIFLTGAGRSDPVARSAAMKLMQTGLQVYVAGDTTTPAIEKGDLLIAISSSGRSTATYSIASAAKNSGAAVFLLTGQALSRIGEISDLVSVLGPDFYKEVGLFIDKLVTLITKKTGKNFTSNNTSTIEQLSELQTVDEVINWCRANLYYRNVDKWDRAPTIESVIRDGYGDCKMLAGVVSVLLDSVGQPNEYIVIKNGAWHMFNTYRKNGKLYVINNAKLVDEEFKNYEDIKRYFDVKEFERVFHNYEDFRSWFNRDVYPRND